MESERDQLKRWCQQGFVPVEGDVDSGGGEMNHLSLDEVKRRESVVRSTPQSLDQGVSDD